MEERCFYGEGQKEVELGYLEYLGKTEKIDEAIQEGANCPGRSVNFGSWKNGGCQGQTRTGRRDGQVLPH